jgi:hypothetical protein
VGLRDKLRRLERGAADSLQSFVLEDGTRHYYDPASAERFLHSCDCLRAQGSGEPFLDPPETIKALTMARDRGVAVEQVVGDASGLFPYDKQALVERGELVPRSLVAGRELGDGPIPDLSE